MQIREQFHEELSEIVPIDTISFDIAPVAYWFLRDSEGDASTGIVDKDYRVKNGRAA